MNFHLFNNFTNKFYHFIFVTCRQKLYLILNGLIQDDRIYTHLTRDEKILLHKILKKQKHRMTCVEIGSFLGASACFISSAISEDSVLYCIDTWGSHNMKYQPEDKDEERDTSKDFHDNTRRYRDKIIEIRAWSSQAIHTLKKYEKKIDCLFIDGDHHYQAVKSDWNLYSPLLKSNALAIFHDSGWAEGVRKVIKESVIKNAEIVEALPNMMVFKMKRVSNPVL